MSRPQFTKKQINLIKGYFREIERVDETMGSEGYIDQSLRDERREVDSLPIARCLLARYVLCGLENESPYRTHKHPPLQMKDILFLRPSHLLALQFGMKIYHHAKQEMIRYDGKPTPSNRRSYRSDRKIACMPSHCRGVRRVYGRTITLLQSMVGVQTIQVYRQSMLPQFPSV